MPTSKTVAAIRAGQNFDRHTMRRIRRMLEIPQHVIARALNRSQFYVAAIERGETVPTADEAAMIWQKLGLTANRARQGKRK